MRKSSNLIIGVRTKRLFYISNGDPSWDAGSLVNVVHSDFRLTHYICASTKYLPIQEDPSKFFPSKTGKPRETKAQSRGERGLQRRYVPGDAFTKLNVDEINLEIEAEEVKRKYKEKKSEAARRHYHTKKQVDKLDVTDNDRHYEEPVTPARIPSVDVAQRPLADILRTPSATSSSPVAKRYKTVSEDRKLSC
ncbi:unnamed protein product [Bemisia tabaci]|uniref:Uncharacterized protein n=1 Tax=Bemisia tabaci TaxID=7038 RepID=A0A9P0A3Y5_BEMTA|nr:unnamed protein product [Bemisia tabaci]